MLDVAQTPCNATRLSEFYGRSGSVVQKVLFAVREIRETLVPVLNMYINEPCRICGKNLTMDDVMDAVFAGYSKDNRSRAAHRACWELNKPKEQWVFPEDDRCDVLVSQL